MDTSAKFREQLRIEQLMHKEHRFKYVIYKLSFVTTLLGIGIIGLEKNILISLIYLVPIVALCYDIYIFAEDYKVKRIGIFLIDIKKNSNVDENTKNVISNLEIAWEEWLKMHRERLAAKASFIITIIVTIGSVIILSIDIYRVFNWFKLFLSTFWFLIVIICIIAVFFYGQSLRREITAVVEKLQSNN